VPNRILHEAQLTSASLNACSEEAELLFNRLTLVADDHGRFDARPAVVRARCFPLRLAAWPEERVQLTLGELEATGMVCFYVVDDRRFLHFVNWPKWQRLRDSVPKWPGPSCGHSPQLAATRGSRASAPAPTSASMEEGGPGEGTMFDAFWSAYPRKVGKRNARTAFGRAVLRTGDASVIQAGAERYRDDPNRLDEFTAHPTTWLNRDGWDDDPLPERGNVSDLRPSERLARRQA